ncbi:hypothetical protein C8F04DRAFT_1207065 [Mycena alexandri]|uniref:DUF1479-domain-containing protein n=1 Tax=Mycena alexandri TaxID=1745969 RepID=A0AAD6RZP4_9AGAR|nr:hypothetical protein C8F04DRAFT_1214624 [Mycena alexandri]KAJ7044313.1 hypothetical protein C8F04DRAFT_1207065 [Mycena alexandri]
MAEQFPPRFTGIKHAIASTKPNFEQHLTKAWNEVLTELDKVTKMIAKEGTAYIPQVSFADLNKLSEAQIADIKRKGTVVIKDVVDDYQARAWKTSLEEFVKANPHAEGLITYARSFYCFLFFFHVYWTKAQIQARAHPNMLAASIWLKNLYHITVEQKVQGYADRFRIRHPGIMWGRHPPHIDGGAIERWEDENFPACFADILSGEWSKHDPYALEPRLDAQTSLYGRPGQSTVVRAFQGWLAISKTGPGQGTLKVFPDILLSNAYIIMRPFFRPLVSLDSKDILDAKNWAFDMSTPDFPGIFIRDNGFWGLRPTTELHPHLLLDATMTSVPAVNPGDTIFWHCDVVHSVEPEHTGSEDSAVMYIPAVPLTPTNARYVERQKDHFLKGVPPPDYATAKTGVGLVGLGSNKDIEEPLGRKAMGLPTSVA